MVRIEAPACGESRRQRLLPSTCGYRASRRLYRLLCLVFVVPAVDGHDLSVAVCVPTGNFSARVAVFFEWHLQVARRLHFRLVVSAKLNTT